MLLPGHPGGVIQTTFMDWCQQLWPGTASWPLHKDNSGYTKVLKMVKLWSRIPNPAPPLPLTKHDLKGNVSPKLPQPKPSHYPSVFHGRILYYTIVTIQVSFMAEYFMLGTGDTWHMTHTTWHVTIFLFLFEGNVRFSVSSMRDFFRGLLLHWL